jgi:ABC-type transport system substrate-binding protein
MKNKKEKYKTIVKSPKFLIFKLCFLIFIFSLLTYAPSYAKEYDGIWFLGFNQGKALFGDENGKVVRQAVTIAIDRDKISKKIIGDNISPVGVIPPGMDGYDSELQAYPHNYGQAKRMMKSIGYSLADPRIKTIKLLHTDGEKTKAIVDEIKIDLINLGFDITTTVVKYSDNAAWEKELKSGKYHMYVMGYKAGNLGQIFIADKQTNIFHTFTCFNGPTNEADIAYFNKYEDAVKAGFSPDTVCKPEPEKPVKTLDLLHPLFYSDGEANFTKFKNKRVDILLEDLTQINDALKVSRQEKFDEISRIIWEECPVVPLFYITKL